MHAIPSVKDEPFSLPISDSLKLYGILNRAVTEPNGNLVIIMHGITGHACEWIHMLGARIFAGQGYDVVRFEFYSDAKDSRRMIESALPDHVSDLNLVLSHFRPNYKKVFCVGHSYGGMTIVAANPDVAAVSLWDTSLYPYKQYWDRESVHDPVTGFNIMYHGVNALAGPKMVNEAADWTLEKTQEAAAAMRAPVQLMISGLHAKRDGQKQIFESFPDPKEVLTFEAGHDFFENDTAFDMIDATGRWFERF